MKCLEQARAQCGSTSAASLKGNPKLLAWRWQKTLVLEIFARLPDRLRTLVELEIGRTLVRSGDGSWVIKHGPGDYKTGSAYGDRPDFRLAQLTPSIDQFIRTHRPNLEPRGHDFLFCGKQGQPPASGLVQSCVRTSVAKFSGMVASPQLLRDLAVTHFRGTDASPAELEGLAVCMGHSVRTQGRVYDKRTQGQKAEPGLRLLASALPRPRRVRVRTKSSET